MSIFDRKLAERADARPIGPRDCRACGHLYRETESWEMPHIWWWSCSKRPGVENLTSFPFQNTKCTDFNPPAQPGADDNQEKT